MPMMMMPAWTSHPTQQCLRCGERYGQLHLCKALCRKCYSCRQYGHIASSTLCPNFQKLTKSQINEDPLHMDAPKTSRSTCHKTNSDCAYICTLMPFADLPDEELTDSVPRSPLTSQSVNVLQQKIQKATNKILSLQNDIKLFVNLIGQLDDFYDQILIENDTENSELHEIIEELCKNNTKWTLKTRHTCSRCELAPKHRLQDCPAYENSCIKCRKLHHFSFCAKIQVTSQQ